MKRFLAGFIALLCCGLVSPLTFTINPNDDALYNVSENYLSVTLDTALSTSVNLSNPKFEPMLRHLAPLVLRFGGTTADSVTFVPDNIDFTGDGIVINSTFWLQLGNIAESAGARLVFCFNSLKRNDDGSWNSTNAEEFIQFNKDSAIDLDFELGNEPDLYQAIYNLQVPATQLAKDFVNLRNILNQYGYNSSKLVGPSEFDVGSNDAAKNYLKTFVSEGVSAVDAITWHHYYFHANDATEELFLSPSTFNYLEQRIKVVTDIVGSSSKVWLGETSSCYGGGAFNKSDKFLASFIWLDKLGLSAKLGLDLIARQTIWGANYPLLDVDYNPNSDWWVSVFYKKIVGTQVLNPTNDGDELATIRLYAHCAKSSAIWGDHAVVVFGVNVDSAAGNFGFAGINSNSSSVYVYELTADSLYSPIRLNGEILNLTEDFELPALEPKKVDVADEYTLPALSLVFYVFPDTTVAACQ